MLHTYNSLSIIVSSISSTISVSMNNIFTLMPTPQQLIPSSSSAIFLLLFDFNKIFFDFTIEKFSGFTNKDFSDSANKDFSDSTIRDFSSFTNNNDSTDNNFHIISRILELSIRNHFSF